MLYVLRVCSIFSAMDSELQEKGLQGTGQGLGIAIKTPEAKD